MGADSDSSIGSSPEVVDLSRPYCSPNIRFASWLTFIVFNLIWIASLSAILTDPNFDDDPTFGYLLAMFWVVFGGVCLTLTIRGLRLAIWISSDRVYVRNYTRSYSVPIDGVTEFRFGFPEARLPLYEQAGSIQLRGGGLKPVAALSEGTLFSTNPTKSGTAMLRALNSALSEAERCRSIGDES